MAEGASLLFLSIVKSFVQTIFIKPFATLISVSFMWTVNGIVRFFPDMAAFIQKFITITYFDVSAPWAQFVATYVNQMTGGKLDASELIGKPAGAMSSGVGREFVKGFMNDMLNMTMPSPSELKSNPLAGAEKYLGTNLKFQLDAWFLHVIGDMVSFGNFKSLKDLPNAISWSMGLGWLSWLVMGVPFKISTTTSMERTFNKIYVPNKMSAAQCIEAQRRGDFGETAEFTDRMAEMGWSPDEAWELYELANKSLSRADMQDLMQYGIFDNNDVDEQLKRQGWSPTQREIIVWLMNNKRSIDIRQDIIKTYIKLFEDGQVSQTNFKEILEDEGWSQEDITSQVILSNIKKSSSKDLTDTTITSATAKGLISWKECRDRLQQKGYSYDDAELYMKVHIPQEKWF